MPPKNKAQSPINEELVECSCCGNPVSPYAINEVEEGIWFCNLCFSEWKKEVKQ